MRAACSGFLLGKPGQRSFLKIKRTSSNAVGGIFERKPTFIVVTHKHVADCGINFVCAPKAE
jgi:hypothetical protein